MSWFLLGSIYTKFDTVGHNRFVCVANQAGQLMDDSSVVIRRWCYCFDEQLWN